MTGTDRERASLCSRIDLLIAEAESARVAGNIELAARLIEAALFCHASLRRLERAEVKAAEMAAIEAVRWGRAS